ncbi:outer membrane beta-barrel protein [Rasiella rasia]|uniref:Outer membrane beta-barrel protein n=1 Tax=Rasiella rasia TaxID=2744027 RepID=A0A6G6GL40_9FLAO|nr:outer membrane beta-barrel protein [Rasiella rasia]QIE59272.1 outer membrane beta-barrel protein [Rasiella rasia]
MKHCLRALIFLCSIATFAQLQPFKISGTLMANDAGQPLESATVYVERVKDSTLVTYTITNQNGYFSIEDKAADKNLKIYITYVGYKTFEKEFVATSEEIELGTIVMKIDANTLDEVVLKSRAPITIKKDTLEFNVSSFKTKKDASVEDLLKKLPGVEVDDEGQITVNGKAVNKILVNGKPFFGDDPTITTRNLTKDIIEKVQVTDTKTDAEAFAGEDADGENKTINLTIKEENNKGIFGRVAAGGGTNDRYEFAGFFNKFDNDQRVSILAGGNNINSPGFSFGEIRKMFGNSRNAFVSGNGAFGVGNRTFGGSDGVTVSRNAGGNYADSFGKKVELSADYFYAGADSEDRTSTQRENILPDSRFFTNSNSESFTENNNHSANVQLDIKVDSTFLINLRPSFTYGKGNRRSSSNEASRDDNNQAINQSSTNSYSENTNRNFNNDLDITKRFGTRGSFIRLGVVVQYDNDTRDDFFQSNVEVFGDTPSQTNRNQFIDDESSLDSYFTDITYRYPILANKLYLDTKFSHREDKRTSIESTFDFDAATQEYTLFNTALSTNFKYINRRSTPGVGLQYSGEKISGNVRASYVLRTLANDDALRPEASFEQRFKALELRGYLTYRFSPKSSLYANYNLNNRPPEISQLQAFQDVSNPLNIITGNPNLEPANEHRVYVGYNNFDFQKRTGFNMYGSFSKTQNQVVQQTIVDENLVRNTTYTNVDGNYYAFAGATYSKDFKVDTLRTVKVSAGLSVNNNRTINFNNGEKYASTNNSLSPNIRLTLTWKKVLELIPNYRPSFTKSTFDLVGFDDRQFLQHTLGLQTATFLPKRLEWRNDINYNYNPDVGVGFQRSSWFWNSTLAYSVLQDTGTLTLKAFDLLGQNANARRSQTQNYIQDSQSLVLQQYFMLSFSWKFNSLGKKGEINDNGGFYIFN